MDQIVASSDAMVIYPNPFEQVFYLEQIEGNPDQAIRASLETLYGQRLDSYDWKDQTVKHEISARDLPAGVYLVRVKVGERKEKTHLIVKQKN